jgi:hypothetical protein
MVLDRSEYFAKELDEKIISCGLGLFSKKFYEMTSYQESD